jgi:Trypsin-like peptidase domain
VCKKTPSKSRGFSCSFGCHNATVAENQLDAVGIVVAQVNDEWDAQGSCFLFRSDALALTAAHCVPEALEPFAVQLPHLGTTLPVERIERHPAADIAMLFCTGEDTLTEIGVPTTAFLDGVGDWKVGEAFYAYGYPTEGPTEDSTQVPVPRLFTGNFQRFMPYVSPGGYRFLAGEMSIPAAGGLSGGPLFKPWGQGPWFSPHAPQIVLGLVAANLDSYAVTDSISEVNDAGKEYREKSLRVIRYGVAVMLSGVADWLNERSPQRPGRGFHLQQA